MVIKNQTIRIRKNQLDKIFPEQFTKMRMEDFLVKAIENKDILNKREFNALMNMKSKMSSKFYNGDFEFFAKKKKGKIELIPFN